MNLLDRGALPSARPCLPLARLPEKSTVNVAGWKLAGKRCRFPVVERSLSLKHKAKYSVSVNVPGKRLNLGLENYYCFSSSCSSKFSESHIINFKELQQPSISKQIFNHPVSRSMS